MSLKKAMYFDDAIPGQLGSVAVPCGSILGFGRIQSVPCACVEVAWAAAGPAFGNDPEGGGGGPGRVTLICASRFAAPPEWCMPSPGTLSLSNCDLPRLYRQLVGSKKQMSLLCLWGGWAGGCAKGQQARKAFAGGGWAGQSLCSVPASCGLLDACQPPRLP